MNLAHALCIGFAGLALFAGGIALGIWIAERSEGTDK